MIPNLNKTSSTIPTTVIIYVLYLLITLHISRVWTQFNNSDISCSLNSCSGLGGPCSEDQYR